MESLLEVPVQPVASHALPFRVVLEEYRRRRFADLLRCVGVVVAEMSVGDRAAMGGAADALTDDQLAELALKKLLERQEAAYEWLELATKAIADGTDRVELDGLVRECRAADEPLKRLLHAMDASAVCLSGGGIRSASISLGVLQGLARFSSKAPDATKAAEGLQEGGLMPSLDYLSTVSGGGYMGSWMMSWVFRRMNVGGSTMLLQAMLTSAKSARRLLTEGPLESAKKEVGELIRTLRADSDCWRKTMAEADPMVVSGMTAVAEKIGTVEGEYERWNADPPEGGTKEEGSSASAAVDAQGMAALLVEIQNALEAVLGLVSKRAFAEVLKGLAGKMATTGGDPEPQPVRHLRSYTSYLAPELGLTLDTFTLGAIVLRNLVVNWLMLVPVLIALIAGVMSSGALMMTVRHSRWFECTLQKLVEPSHEVPGFFADWQVKNIIVCIAFVLAGCFAGGAIPSVAEYRGRPMNGRKTRTYVFLALVVVGAWFVTAGGSTRPTWWEFWGLAGLSFVGFGVLSGYTFVIYTSRAAVRSKGASRTGWVVLLGLIGATVFMAFATSGVMYVVQRYGFRWLEGLALPEHVRPGAHFATFAYPLTLVALNLCAVVYCALIGLFEGEDDREWWARCSGVLLAAALGWMVVHAVVLYGDWGFIAAWSAATGTALGGVASFLGFSAKTPASKTSVNTSQLSGVGKFLTQHDLMLPVAGGIAILLITLSMVWVEERVREQLPGAQRAGSLVVGPPPGCLAREALPQVSAAAPMGAGRPATPLREELASAALLCGIAAVVAFGFNLFINVNLFSLHGMYRMRLMRAFLGASNVFRQPDRFTEFDRKDTPHEALMPCFAGAPMHLLNATLNLTGTSKSAWRQRKAEGFSFSPVVCGGWRVGFVPTTMYAGSKGLGNKNNGLTLATAMAISGAAANPNMGYQSSPVLSLIMTFFNLRLGCWLPNPARPKSWWPWAAQGEVFFRKSGPTFALWPLMAEALELTDDKYRWVELTDGGHFEDLALYEMVLRRVKKIIVVDGGADGGYGFEDLGNAVRKIQIDLGVPIEFDMPMGMHKPADKASRYCAVGRIRYTCIDHGAGVSDGKLVYIKASLTDHEPADILQYARLHASFPHESTGDQFFTESQFESYRHLGSFMVEEIARKGVREDGSSTGDGSMGEFIRVAGGYCSQGVVGVEESC